MKKRIFIAMHYMEIGGAESALIGLLRALDYTRVDVDLFLYAHRGELMDLIPPQVNILPEKKAYSVIEIPVAEALRRGHIGVVTGRILARLSHRHMRRLTGNHHPDTIFDHIGRYVTMFLPRIGNGVYDLAISFLAPHNAVLSKVRATHKICWIHTDYSFIGMHTAIAAPVWEAYDNIISISPAVTEAFCRQLPHLRHKIVEIENIMDGALIRTRAEAASPCGMETGTFNILSIGRFTDQKNFESVPLIMRRLIEITGRDDLRWYLIGFGPGEDLIRRLISEAGVERHVIMLGKKENPYPYIKTCALYVQPSLFEGKAVTVREAQMLGRPVVITNYATAHSQVDDGNDGVIVPLEPSACAGAIARIISDPALLSRLSDTCLGRDYSCSTEIDKIYSIIP